MIGRTLFSCYKVLFLVILFYLTLNKTLLIYFGKDLHTRDSNTKTHDNWGKIRRLRGPAAPLGQ